MKKTIKTILIIASALTLAFLVFYLFATPRIDFNFANEGKVICVEHKNWGIFSKGDLICFRVLPLNSSLDTLMQNIQKLDENDEIILKK